MATEDVHLEKPVRAFRAPLRIQVQKLNGDSKTMEFELDCVGVSTVKSVIEKQMGVPVKRQKLSNLTSVLEDSEMLTKSCQLNLTVLELCEHITLIAGDPSDKDIGGEEIHIKANMSGKDIEAAYKKGCEIVGFNLQEEYCAYNEEDTLPAVACGKLQELGFDFLSLHDVEDVEVATTTGLKLRWCRSQAWPALWLFVAKLGAPDLHYELERSSPHRIEIGGCGLYVDF